MTIEHRNRDVPVAFFMPWKGGNLMELSMREKELLIMFGSERRLRKIPMIKKVHDVLIYQRTYHKDIATRFSIIL